MAEIDDQQLLEAIERILKNGDLAKLSVKSVRADLEQEFNTSLASKKMFIKDHIQRLVAEIEAGRSGEAKAKKSKEEKAAAKAEKKAEKEKKPKKRKAEDAVEEDTGKARKGGGGFSKLMYLSPPLAELTGQTQMARPQVVKFLWDYYKKHNLQNPDDKRQIILDEPLQKVFKRKTVTMFSMNQFLTPHLHPTSEGAAAGGSVSGDGSESDGDNTDDKPKAKKGKTDKGDKPKSGGGGFSAPMKLSDSMAKFVGSPAMSRSQVVKALWAYIKKHELQNPDDKREIICDAALEDLLGQKKVTMFTMNKFMGPHFVGGSASGAAGSKKGKKAAAAALPPATESESASEEESQEDAEGLDEAKGDEADKKPSASAPPAASSPAAVSSASASSSSSSSEPAKMSIEGDRVKEETVSQPAAAGHAVEAKPEP